MLTELEYILRRLDGELTDREGWPLGRYYMLQEARSMAEGWRA